VIDISEKPLKKHIQSTKFKLLLGEKGAEHLANGKVSKKRKGKESIETWIN
jgi:hypothetical protein